MSRDHGRRHLNRLHIGWYLARLRVQAYAAVTGRFLSRA